MSKFIRFFFIDSEKYVKNYPESDNFHRLTIIQIYLLHLSFLTKALVLKSILMKNNVFVKIRQNFPIVSTEFGKKLNYQKY